MIPWRVSLILAAACLGPNAAAGGGLDRFASAEFRINTQVYGDQRVPLLAARPDGETLVVWQTRGPPGNSWDVVVRRIDADGQLLAPEYRANAYGIGRQDGQHAAALPSGGWVVAWNGESRAGTSQGIHARRLDPAGDPVGSDLEVGGQSEALHILPRVTETAQGGFLVAWEGRGIFDDTMSIHGQAFNADGNLDGPLLRVSRLDDTQQRRVDLARGAAGRTLFAWQSSLRDGDSWGIYGRCLGDDGSDSGDFRISQTIEGAQSQPRVAALPDGGFAVVWQDDRGRSAFEYRRVMLRRLDAQCQPVGDERQVNQFDEGIQDLPAISASPDGAQIVVWQSLPEAFEDQGIVARRIGADGDFHGDELRVSVEREAYQDFPDVETRPGGGFLAVWESVGQELSGFGIFGRLFDGPAAALLETVSGDNQPAALGQAFAEPLVVRVRDQWGVALPGQPVRFASSSTDPGIVFADGTSTRTVTTDAQGLAAVEAFANDQAGTHEVRVEVPDSPVATVMRLSNLGGGSAALQPVPLGDPGSWLLLAAALLLAGWAALRGRLRPFAGDRRRHGL